MACGGRKRIDGGRTAWLDGIVVRRRGRTATIEGDPLSARMESVRTVTWSTRRTACRCQARCAGRDRGDLVADRGLVATQDGAVSPRTDDPDDPPARRPGQTGAR
jgi:hypothetical protein